MVYYFVLMDNELVWTTELISGIDFVMMSQGFKTHSCSSIVKCYHIAVWLLVHINRQDLDDVRQSKVVSDGAMMKDYKIICEIIYTNGYAQ